MERSREKKKEKRKVECVRGMLTDFQMASGAGAGCGTGTGMGVWAWIGSGSGGKSDDEPVALIEDPEM